MDGQPIDPHDERGMPASPAAPEARVLEHLSLVRMIAAKLYRMRWNDRVGFDDYYQMGAAGLVEASSRFDERRGVPFGAFACWRITGSILNGLERATEQHQQIAARKRLLRERTDSLAAGASERPRAAETSLEAALSHLAAVAIGLAVGFMLEGSGMYSDGSESSAMDGYADLSLRQWRARFRHAVAALPDQERTVIQDHYFQGRPFAEIASSLGLTRGRIAQIHRQGLERLRDRLPVIGCASFEA